MIGEGEDGLELPVDRRGEHEGIETIAEGHEGGDLRVVDVGAREHPLERGARSVAAFARVRQARVATAAAGAQLLPTADFGATGTALQQGIVSPIGSVANSFPGYSRDQREYTFGAAASWEIDLSGGLRRGAAAAADELQAAQAEQVWTRITVAAEAADAYLQVREFQARLAVAQQLIDTDTHLLELVGVRRRVEVADDREVAQAEALLKQAKSTAPSLRVTLEAQLNRLDWQPRYRQN